MLVIFVFFTFICFQNYMRAKLGKLNPVKWSLLTLVASFATTLMGASVLMFMMLERNPNMVQELQKTPVSNDLLMKGLENSGFIMPDIFVLVWGFGGYLLIRYLLDKKVNLQS